MQYFTNVTLWYLRIYIWFFPPPVSQSNHSRHAEEGEILNWFSTMKIDHHIMLLMLLFLFCQINGFKISVLDLFHLWQPLWWAWRWKLISLLQKLNQNKLYNLQSCFDPDVCKYFERGNCYFRRRSSLSWLKKDWLWAIFAMFMFFYGFAEGGYNAMSKTRSQFSLKLLILYSIESFQFSGLCP